MAGLRFKAAVVQLECKLGRSSGNMRRAERRIAAAARAGAQLICLPEAFLTSGNILEVKEVAVPIPGPATDRLCELAREGGVYIVAGLLERAGAAEFYSTSVLCAPDGSLAGTYRRVHVHELESRYIGTGGEYPVFDTELGRIGLLQGYDLNFPEASRELFRRQADTIVCSALVPEMYAYITHTLLPARAIDAECYLIFASGVGANPFAGFNYMGQSQVLADPLFLESERFDFMDGEERMIELEAEEDQRIIELDVGRLRTYREKNTLLNDLRPSTYWHDLEPLGA